MMNMEEAMVTMIMDMAKIDTVDMTTMDTIDMAKVAIMDTDTINSKILIFQYSWIQIPFS